MAKARRFDAVVEDIKDRINERLVQVAWAEVCKKKYATYLEERAERLVNLTTREAREGLTIDEWVEWMILAEWFCHKFDPAVDLLDKDLFPPANTKMRRTK